MSFSIVKYHFITGSLLEGLPREEFRLMRGSMQRLEYKRGKVLYPEGSYSKGVYIVRKGKIKIYQVNKDGKEQIAYIYGKGEIMGYRPLLCNETHPVSACALEDSVVSFIPKKIFLGVIDASPALAHRLLVNLSHEFSVLINKITVFAQQPVRSRVALSLLILNEKYRNPRSKAKHVTINLSREDLANFSGTTIESLVRVLRSLKDERIIQAKGRRIVILQPPKLEEIADTY
jgi:CRP-like cAMP-binding protein